MDDFRQKQFEPPYDSADPGYWQVHIAVDPAEGGVISNAAPRVVPGERVEVHFDLAETGEGDVVLALKVYARSSGEATEEASRKYRVIRERAGLAPAPTLVLGYISPWWEEPATRISREVPELMKQERYELAVVRLQTANELRIAKALKAMLSEQYPDSDTAALVRRPATLRDKQSRALLELLTGKRVQDAPWWPAYSNHLKRRNAIVHEGLAITGNDAEESWRAVLDLREWLLDVQGVPELDSDGSDGDDAALE